jgi:hypothetical protein
MVVAHARAAVCGHYGHLHHHHVSAAARVFKARRDDVADPHATDDEGNTGKSLHLRTPATSYAQHAVDKCHIM